MTNFSTVEFRHKPRDNAGTSKEHDPLAISKGLKRQNLMCCTCALLRDYPCRRTKSVCSWSQSGTIRNLTCDCGNSFADAESAAPRQTFRWRLSGTPVIRPRAPFNLSSVVQCWRQLQRCYLRYSVLCRTAVIRYGTARAGSELWCTSLSRQWMSDSDAVASRWCILNSDGCHDLLWAACDKQGISH